MKPMYLTLSLALTAASIFAQDSARPAEPTDKDDVHTFEMIVSAGAKSCVPDASATVSIRPAGQVEIMDVSVRGLPADTDFNLFVIQVPKAPFGVAWYQGDIHTDKHGRGHVQ